MRTTSPIATTVLLMLSFVKSYIHAGLSDIPFAIVSRRLVSLSRDTLLSSLALLLKHQLGYSLDLIFWR